MIEIEAKFAVEETTPSPDLTALKAVDRVAETVHHELSAVYYDTADLRLTRAKVTFRRRTGGKDEGWHVKLPAGAGRLELFAELTDSEQMPEELISQIRSIVRDQPLQAIAQVDNRRAESILVDHEGAPVAEFCDDRVTAWSFLPGGERTSWREWEVELAGEMPGTPEGTTLLRNATTVLVAAGAREASSPSKLVSALGHTRDEAPLPPHLRGSGLGEDHPAYPVVQAIKAGRDELIRWDPRVRRDEHDAVHQMRVATRELRSQLNTFDGVLAHEAVKPVAANLRDLARVLGEARDAEVVEARLHDLLERDATGLIDATAARHIREDMRSEYESAHLRIIDALNSQRYLDLLDSIDALIAQPPLEQASDAPAEANDVLFDHLAQAYEKLMKRHQRVQDNYDNPELSLHQREVHVHDMRKAAKKLRYAARSVEAWMPSGKLVAHCKRLQSVLGDFQDAVTARDRLREMAEDAARNGEDTFAYGMLYQVEMDNAAAALAGYDDIVADIKRAWSTLSASR